MSLALEIYATGNQASSYAWDSLFCLDMYNKYKTIHGVSFALLLLTMIPYISYETSSGLELCDTQVCG